MRVDAPPRMRRITWLATLLLAGAASGADMKKVEPGADAYPPPPPFPAIEKLELLPAALTLEDGRDSRHVLVWGIAADGSRYDLTGEASLKAESDAVKIDEDGYIVPRAKGETGVVVTAGGRTARLPVKVLADAKPKIGFVTHIEPLLGKAGCNSGSCHGSAQGKNGFKLSLRGYDSDFDYQSLVFDLSGRRFNRVVPEESLMALKPTGAIPHEGRQVVKPDSRHYWLLMEWIGAGTPPQEAAARANRLEVLPEVVDVDLPGRTQRLIVLAHYPDGRVRDVTRDAIITSNDINVLAVKDNVLMTLRRGEAAALVRYEGNYATRLVTVMGDRTGFAWTEPETYTYVDVHAAAKWKRMKILPSELCADDEFLRRVSIDLTGIPPTPEQARAFAADPAPSRAKRERLVDELLASEAYVECWTNKWTDLLQCNSEALGKKGVQVFRDWIRRAIAENRPYDRFVRELLLAQGSAYFDPATNYYRVLRETGKMTEDISQTFLGVRFNCNKCHDHPFENWTQRQYYQFGAFFARVAIKRGTLGEDLVKRDGADLTLAGEEIVYLNPDGGEVAHPKTGLTVVPKVPVGESAAVAEDHDRREAFVDWLTSKDNPYFAKAMANRIWSYFFGRGIIDPVDDIRTSNPASIPALLDALTEDFVKGGWNLRRLMRAICTSRTYQLSIKTHRWNEDDRINFSHCLPRRLSAEQMLDAVAVATDVPANFAGLPPGTRAVEIADGMADNTFLTLFGRPKRKSSCECERTSNFSLSHTMSLINGPTISDAIHAPDSRLARLVAAEPDDRKVVAEIYLAFLGRAPSAHEIEDVRLSPEAAAKPKGFTAGGCCDKAKAAGKACDHACCAEAARNSKICGKCNPGADADPRLEAAQDLAWALVNSPAFLFNR